MISNIALQQHTPAPASTMIPNSIFIPHVFDYITLNDLKNMLENTNNGIGSIYKIESIPKENEKDGHHYYSAFVYFETFYNTNLANYMMQNMFCQNQQVKFYYDKENKYTNENSYMILTPNTSYNSQFNVKHMDLVFDMHKDVTEQTLFEILEALDFGKVHHIDVFGKNDIDTNIGVWNIVNSKKTETYKISLQFNKVFVRMDYWYKTQIALNIQYEIGLFGFSNVGLGNGLIITFFETDPMFNGTNPYVWNKYI